MFHQLVRGFNLARTMVFLQLLQNPPIGQFWHNFLVAEAGEIPFFMEADLVVPAASVHHIGGNQIGLSGKDIHYCFGGIRLKFLVFELKLHLFATQHFSFNLLTVFSNSS